MDTILAHTHLHVLWDCWSVLLILAHAHTSSSALFRDSETCSTPPQACDSCALAADASSQAQPFSLPNKGTGQWESSCYVDFQRRMYEVSWMGGGLNYPNLSTFPIFDGAIHPVTTSDTITKVFAASTFLNFGSNACVRCSHLEPLPIIKMAHPNKLSRLRIQYEFEMLREMRRRGLPIPLFDEKPLSDDDGVFGYRMERLFPIDLQNPHAVSEDLKAIVARVHACGFSHGDLSPSNVMRNSGGSLVLIDPSYSGVLGQQIPCHVPSWQYEGDIFSTGTDEKFMKRFFGCTTRTG